MIERIKQIMEFAELSPARFAEVIGINRAAMSHYLSGRNNPSLDVLNKILDVYPDINPLWLYRGFGEMFTDVNTSVNIDGSPVNRSGELTLFTNVLDDEIPSKVEESNENNAPLDEEISEPLPTTSTSSPSPLSRSITKIIVYYSDQTFEIFTKDQFPIF